jgi:hypothetical protein
MGIKDIGRLLGADEGLNHQIVDTFATLSQSELAWTEKIWASLARVDGSLQVDFGLGKYQNRGIIDGFGGISRGREQWTVGGSRVLHSAPEDMAVGPIRMEVVEPLKQMRFRLEPDDVQPISFDIVLTGVTPPFFEDRNLVRNRQTGRVDVDVIRYHQGGWASGTVTVGDETHEVNPEEWFGFRDHSWGVRQAIGEPLVRRMCQGMAEQLAQIHLVDLDAVSLAGLDDGTRHRERELNHWADEMHRVQRGPLSALEQLLHELRDTTPEAHPRITLVHGDAKPGNFAFVGDDVSAVFDWEMTTVGDPLTDIGWMELLWMQPVGITSHPAAIGFDEFLSRYTEVSGIQPANRLWYRALNAYKMAVICLIGSMLYADGSSTDERFVLNASGIPLLTQLGLSDLGITEKLEDGPVLPG